MTDQQTERAVLAGGCFWGMQDLIRNQPGVHTTRVGYTGGTLENATYAHVKTGTTGHAESIEITFDPAIMSYEKLLHWFFQIHDPTTKDRQGNDRGSQYRSAIFYESDAQREIAEKVIGEVNASGKWPGPVVTEVSPAGAFWTAEEEHQDYLEKYPNGYTCHYVRPDWVV
jgi:peptide-methionine (S)-S-oxide reductase